MNDLYHYLGNDLVTSATGDLLPVDGTAKGQQRVLRRLLTNPGDYIFHPTYGAGLPKMIGDTLDISKITALIRSQIFLEAAVAKTPEPQIKVSAIPNGVSCSIRYVDSVTKKQAALSFNVDR